VAGQQRHLSQDPEAEQPDPIHAYLPREDAEAGNASATAGRGQRRPPSRATLRNAEQRSIAKSPPKTPCSASSPTIPSLVGKGGLPAVVQGGRGIASIFTLCPATSLMENVAHLPSKQQICEQPSFDSPSFESRLQPLTFQAVAPSRLSSKPKLARGHRKSSLSARAKRMPEPGAGIWQRTIQGTAQPSRREPKDIQL
jgi:hypothetical protein